MKFKIFHDVSTKIFPYCWKKHPDLDANNSNHDEQKSTSFRQVIAHLVGDTGTKRLRQ